jgi:hypothetical protein
MELEISGRAMKGCLDTIRNWGTTLEERRTHFPCDDVLPNHADAYFRAVTVHVDAPVMFRWLCQLRAAPYSYDWIDNFGRQSPRRLTPGLEELAIGQPVMRIFDLVAFERDRHMTLRLRTPGLFPPLAVSYVVAAVGPRQCRLLVKLAVENQPGMAGRIAGLFLPLGDWIMMRRQLLNLKELAEASDDLG